MSEYATNGAMLVCTCGTTPTPLQTTGNTLTSVQGQFIATTADKAPMANIKPFGPCKMKPTLTGYAPCVPAPVAWTGFLTSIQLPGGNPLLKTSMLQCSCGGMIQFQDSGQKKSAKVVINPSSPQIDALKKAAIEAIPFCEECEKKKKAAKPKILKVYWMDEQGEPRQLSELCEGQKVTLCIEVEEGGAGSTVDVKIIPPDGKTYKGKKLAYEYKGLSIEDDNFAYIENFTVEYD